MRAPLRLLLLLAAAVASARSPAGAQAAALRIHVAMVAEDGTVHPVAGIDLLVFRPGGRDTARVTTDGGGVAAARVAPGAYRVVSVQAVEFGGGKYDWQVPVTVGRRGARLELTQRNAAARPAASTVRDGEDGATVAELASAGRTLAAAGRVEEAEPLLLRALERYPHSRDALAALVPILEARARRLEREAAAARGRSRSRLLARADSAFRALAPLAARLAEVDPNNPAALDRYEEVLRRSGRSAEVARVRAVRSEMRAVVDSLRMVVDEGPARVEGMVTPGARDRGAMIAIVVTFVAADGTELAKAMAPVRLLGGARSARFAVRVPPAARSAAGYRYEVRIGGSP